MNLVIWELVQHHRQWHRSALHLPIGENGATGAAAHKSVAQMPNSTALDVKSSRKERFATAMGPNAPTKAAQAAPKARCASATLTKTALPAWAKSTVPYVHAPQPMMLFYRLRPDHAVMSTVSPAKTVTTPFADLETTGPTGVNVLSVAVEVVKPAIDVSLGPAATKTDNKNATSIVKSATRMTAL